MSVKTLNEMGLTRATHIESGFHGWKDDGLPIVSYDEWRASRDR